MTMLGPPREQTYRTVDHPRTLQGRVRHGERLVLVIDEAADWIRRDLDDPRYALYANPVLDRWDLYRLEHDGVYRHEFSSQSQNLIGAYHDIVTHVRAHDTRAGFDLVAHMDREEARVERSRDRDFSDFNQDFADHYMYPALRKDGAHRHVVG